jgi:hypothetical protein
MSHEILTFQVNLMPVSIELLYVMSHEILTFQVNLMLVSMEL